MRNKIVFALLLLAAVTPEIAAASGGITEFSSPLEQGGQHRYRPGR